MSDCGYRSKEEKCSGESEGVRERKRGERERWGKRGKGKSRSRSRSRRRRRRRRKRTRSWLPSYLRENEDEVGERE